MDYAEKANKTYPSGEINMNIRAAHLIEARASLSALDVRLTHCYTILMQNPQGAFSKSLSSTEATRRLDHMAQELGELINREDSLLKGVIKNDRKKMKI